MWFTPAVCTGQVAGIDVWCHLHATTTFDAVECALVAGTVMLEVLLGPMTNFDTTVLTNEVITLFGKLGRNLRFNLCNRALHVRNLRQHIPQWGSVGWWPDRCR